MATSDADTAPLPLNLIGTQAFLSALLGHIRGLATTQSLPLDPVIFQSILLCLIAGEKHLILRTAEEDIGLTVKIVVWTLSCVFDIPTRKLRIRGPSAGSGPPSTPSASTSSRPSKFKSAASDPAAFLRALFLHGASSSSNSNETSQDEYDAESAKHHHHRRHSKRAKQRTRHAHAPEYARSHSVPNNLVNIAHTAHVSAVAPGVPRTTSPESLLMGSNTAQQQKQQQQQQRSRRDSTTTTSAPLPILRPQPIYPSLSSGSHHLPHAYTDPLPRPRSTHSKAHAHQRTPSGVSSTAGASQGSRGDGGAAGPPQFPSAVVLSGLEDASERVQRAFGRVLSEKRVVLGEGDAEEARALPEGFFVVYVCPWSATERPAVHKTLLDKFAMSTNVTIPANIRREFHLLPFSPVPKPFSPLYNHQQQSTSTAIPSPKKMFFSHSNPGTPSPGQAHALPPQSSYTPPPVPPTALPASTASMHRRASSHSSHSFRSHAYTYYSHATTHRHSHSHYSQSTLQPPAPAALFPYPPIPSSFLKTLQTIAVQHTRIAPALTLYMADIFSATRHHPRLECTLLGRAAQVDAEALVRARRVVGADLTGMELLRPEVGLGADDTSGLEEGDEDPYGYDNLDEDEGEEDEMEDYSSALDILIHNEPLISVRAPSVASTVMPGAGAATPLGGIGVLDVSEVNIARIVPRVISHRVRVRSGPEDEVLASALFGATFRPPVPQAGAGKVDGEEGEGGADLEGEERVEGEVSVKGVLVQILAEV